MHDTNEFWAVVYRVRSEGIVTCFFYVAEPAAKTKYKQSPSHSGVDTIQLIGPFAMGTDIDAATLRMTRYVERHSENEG